MDHREWYTDRGSRPRYPTPPPDPHPSTQVRNPSLADVTSLPGRTKTGRVGIDRRPERPRGMTRFGIDVPSLDPIPPWAGWFIGSVTKTPAELHGVKGVDIFFYPT